jgi:2-hydroxy-3-keto-5-methylthiopentenyl-1-phosphate phosphatase
MALLSLVCYAIGPKETRRLKIQVFSDFDGTVTRRDTLVHLLDRYIGDSWYEIEDRVDAGSLSEELGLRQEIALLDAPFPEALAMVLAEVPVDHGFASFVEFCEAKNWPLTILSGGLHPLIEAVLKNEGLERVPVQANNLTFDEDGRWRVLPASTPRIKALCNHCKSWWLEKSTDPVIYIGDGTTDRCPGERADLLFAKAGLADWCEKKGVAHIRWENFDEIIAWLSDPRGEAWLETLPAP